MFNCDLGAAILQYKIIMGVGFVYAKHKLNLQDLKLEI